MTETSSSDMTLAMLSLLSQYRAGTPFQAQDVENDSLQLQPSSEQSPVLLHAITEQGALHPMALSDTHAQRRIQNTEAKPLPIIIPCIRNGANPRPSKWRGYGKAAY